LHRLCHANRRTAFFGTALFSILLLSSPSAFGAGYSIFEQGSKATGMGGAFAATADDPSAMFYNVAGIAFQREGKAMLGGTIITFKNQFEGAADSFPGAGVTGSYEDHIFTPPNTYIVVPFGENVTFGLGQFTAFGLRTDWVDGHRFAGRFISQDANLKTSSVQPSFAMKTANGRFAFGIGAEYRIANLSLERNIAAINPFTLRIADVAHIRLKSEWEGELGFNAGVIFAPSDTLRIGLSYRAPMDIDFNGEAKFTQIPTGNAQLDAIIRATRLPPDQDITTTLPFPAFTHLGVATTAIPDWTVEFDVVHMGWSRFEDLEVEFQTTPANNLFVEQNWEDALSYRIGGNRPVTENWDIRLGAVYDETPQPVEAAGPLLPDSNRIGVSFGVGYRRGPISVEFSDMVLHFEDRNTLGRNQDNFNGEYRTSANLVGLNIGYSF